jgi:hypothetical protein
LISEVFGNGTRTENKMPRIQATGGSELMQAMKNVKDIRQGAGNDSRGLLVRPGAFSCYFPFFSFIIQKSG